MAIMNVPLEQRLGNFKDWFDMKNERPLLGFFPGSQYPLHRYPGSRKNIPDGIVRPDNIVAEDFLEDCDALYKLHENCGGDLIWSAAPFFGLPWIEASLGCTVIADHQAGSTRSEPPEDFLKTLHVPEFDPGEPWIKKLDEFYDILNEYSGGRYPVGQTLMRGVADLLSALYGNERFIYRVMDEPGEVRMTAEKLSAYWIDLGKHISEKIQLFHGGTGAFFYSVWCPGKTMWLQEDAAAILSPSVYDDLIYPSDLEIIRNFENTVIHFHPSKFFPLDRLISSDISVIEIHIDKGGPRAQDLFEKYLRVLEKKPLIIWGDMSEGELDFIMEKVPHRGLLVNMVVSSQEEADRIWSRYNK
jgi:hypothetical protein